MTHPHIHSITPIPIQPLNKSTTNKLILIYLIIITYPINSGQAPGAASPGGFQLGGGAFGAPQASTSPFMGGGFGQQQQPQVKTPSPPLILSPTWKYTNQNITEIVHHLHLFS